MLIPIDCLCTYIHFSVCVPVHVCVLLNATDVIWEETAMSLDVTVDKGEHPTVCTGVCVLLNLALCDS